MEQSVDVCIIGGGAAGLFCAFHAARKGLSVIVLEHTDSVGKKIRISGGGRCNFTNYTVKPEHYISENPHFHKSALARYTSHDFISLVQSHHIPYHEKTLGQLFCDNSSKDIIAMLLHECSAVGVEIQTGVSISSIEKNEYFHIHTHTRDVISRTVVIACGGTAIPAMGASDFGLRIARQFELKIIAPYPALVPLLWRSEDKHWSELAGLSVYVETSASSAHFKENMLFTHKGLSGPAILQISSYCKGKHPFFVNLSPNHDLAESLFNPQHRDQSLSTVLSFILPQRLAKNICALNNYQKPLKQYSKNEIEHIISQLMHWEITPNGTEGFAKAEVMGGGVSTDELSSKTMESKKVKGLYFIGEVVDVTGWLGGYNFQWAWSSAYAASEALV
jgi:predicted Rossmann fold flavoprotein